MRTIFPTLFFFMFLSYAAAQSATFQTVTGEDAKIYSAGMAVGDVDGDGLWDYFSANSLYFGTGQIQAGSPVFSGTSLFQITTSTTGIGPGDSVLFLDFLNDGRTHIFLNDRAYNDGPHYLFSSTNAAGEVVFTMTNSVIQNMPAVWHGGVVALDLDCDGSLDLVYGDRYVDDGFYRLNNVSNIYSDAGTQHFLTQTASSSASSLNIINYGNYGEGLFTSTQQRYTYYIGAEVGAFDMNGDGRIDLVGNANIRNSNNNKPNSGGNRSSLAVRLAGDRVSPLSGAATVCDTHQVFRWADNGTAYNAFVKGAQTVAVADYTGDGILDLFTAQSADRAWQSADTTGNSKLWAGNGSGMVNLNWTGYDGFTGGALLPVDWNLDGRMDVFEFKDNGDTSTTLKTGNRFLLWENISQYGNVGFVSQEFNVSALVDHVISAVALDYDYDGARDLIISANNADIALKNDTTILDGTCLHLKILNPQGRNVFMSHTVHLFDGNGERVATRVLNPQYGYGVNDSTAVVDFYALDPAETYSAALVKTDGKRSDVYANGGYHTIVGDTTVLSDNAMANVANGMSTENSRWSNLKPGNGTDASYVLSAESGANAHDGDFTGTGYNDTFFATPGHDHYNGSGGWANGVWHATGGVDIIDYGAFDTAMTFDFAAGRALLNDAVKDTFVNIEGIAGTSGDDTFISAAGINGFFEGRGGDDIFQLGNGGANTLIYTAQNTADVRGGLGHDHVYGFGAGRLDLRGLPRYIKSHVRNGDTVLHAALARDGAFLPFITLHGVETTLGSLLDNGQLLVADTSRLIFSTIHNVPYEWLDQYGLVTGNTSADYDAADLADPDNNAFPNWQEYVAGTDPTNRFSRFQITLLDPSETRTRLMWQPDLVLSNRVYTVHAATNLTDAVWPAAPHDGNGTDGATIAPNGARFFRVNVELP